MCCLSLREATIAIAIMEIVGSFLAILTAGYTLTIFRVFVGVDENDDVEGLIPTRPTRTQTADEKDRNNANYIKFRGGLDGISLKIDIDPNYLLTWTLVVICLCTIHLIIGAMLIIGVRKMSGFIVQSWLFVTYVLLLGHLFYTIIRAYPQTNFTGLNEEHFRLSENAYLILYFVFLVFMFGAYGVVRRFWKQIRRQGGGIAGEVMSQLPTTMTIATMTDDLDTYSPPPLPHHSSTLNKNAESDPDLELNEELPIQDFHQEATYSL